MVGKFPNHYRTKGSVRVYCGEWGEIGLAQKGASCSFILKCFLFFVVVPCVESISDDHRERFAVSEECGTPVCAASRTAFLSLSSDRVFPGQVL